MQPRLQYHYMYLQSTAHYLPTCVVHLSRVGMYVHTYICIHIGKVTLKKDRTEHMANLSFDGDNTKVALASYFICSLVAYTYK